MRGCISRRGLYALQGRKSGPCSLPKGRPTGNKMCDRPVRRFSYLFSQHSRPLRFLDRINKMRENCLQQFEAHWNCLESNNQVCFQNADRTPPAVTDQNVRTKEYAPCRKLERTLNKCMFEKLVRDSAPIPILLFYSFLPPIPRVLLNLFLGPHLARHPYMRSKTHCLAVCRNDLGMY